MYYNDTEIASAIVAVDGKCEASSLLLSERRAKLHNSQRLHKSEAGSFKYGIFYSIFMIRTVLLCLCVQYIALSQLFKLSKHLIAIKKQEHEISSSAGT